MKTVKEKAILLGVRGYKIHKLIMRKHVRLSRGKLSESEIVRRALEEYDQARTAMKVPGLVAERNERRST